jgi:hypothetical protein
VRCNASAKISLPGGFGDVVAVFDGGADGAGGDVDGIGAGDDPDAAVGNGDAAVGNGDAAGDGDVAGDGDGGTMRQAAIATSSPTRTGRRVPCAIVMSLPWWMKPYGPST